MASNDTIQIRGIEKDSNPVLYPIIERMMEKYGFKNIRVSIPKRGFNAFAISLFGSRIIITRKLLETLNQDELDAVIAHEFSHLYNRDSSTIMTVLMVFFIPMMYFWMQFSLNPTSLVYGLMTIVTLIAFIFGMRVINWIKLNLEIIADRDAVMHIGNAQGLENALFKMYNHIRTEDGRPPNLIKAVLSGIEYIVVYFFGFTHPFLKERIEHLEFAHRIIQKADNNQNA